MNEDFDKSADQSYFSFFVHFSACGVTGPENSCKASFCSELFS